MMRGEPNTVVLTEDMKQVVREQRLGFAATVCPDGTPNLSPKGTTAVWDDEHLIFADIRSPQTVQNLRANPAIEVNVVDPIARTGYRFKGQATVVDGGQLFEQILAFYEAGDAPVTDAGTRVRAAVLVNVERAAARVTCIRSRPHRGRDPGCLVVPSRSSPEPTTTGTGSAYGRGPERRPFPVIMPWLGIRNGLNPSARPEAARRRCGQAGLQRRRCFSCTAPATDRGSSAGGTGLPRHQGRLRRSVRATPRERRSPLASLATASTGGIE